MDMPCPPVGSRITVAIVGDYWFPNAEVVYGDGDEAWTLQCSDGIVRHINPAHVLSWREADGTEHR